MSQNILLCEDGSAWNKAPYTWISSAVTVAGTNATTLLTATAAFADIFKYVKRAHHITVEVTGTTYMRLNGATNDKITLTSSTPYENDFIVIDKIYISTNNAAITVTVKLT